MKTEQLEKYAAELLGETGIELNGDKPCDIQVHHPDFYTRVLKYGSLGLGESYMEHWWDCERLDEFFVRVFEADIEGKLKSNHWMMLKMVLFNIINLQTKRRALEVGKKHYDLGNDLFKAMLDKKMNYTCGYWRHANNLDDAQLDKLELSCQKLMLKPGMRVLDIGCGFGAFAKYAAEKYEVSVTGVTISKQQYDYAKDHCRDLPIEIHFQDYREVTGEFDRIVSLGMFEHVGQKNYLTYMQKVHQCLKDDGLFLLHTIGSNISNISGDPWITKYIFPNSMLPSIAQIGRASEKLLIMEDWHNFGADYDKTLMAWHHNFNQHWQELQSHYDQSFYRMWTFYLLSSAATFRARTTQLWQILFSKQGVKGGYQAPRSLR